MEVNFTYNDVLADWPLNNILGELVELHLRPEIVDLRALGD